MKTQSKKLDFTGQNMYTGIDVHKKSWTVSIFCEDMFHKKFSQPPQPEVLVNYLKKMFPGATYHCAYEAGFSGFWTYRKFIDLGVNCIVANAADVPTTDKERQQKDDGKDSLKLAMELRNGKLNGVYVPSPEGEQDRTLVRTRQNLQGNLTRCKNRVKSLLNHYGIEMPEKFIKSGHWSKIFMGWLHTLKFSHNSGTTSLQLFLSEATFLRQLLLQANREIRELSRSERYAIRMKLLQTVPCIGLLGSMILLTEIEDFNRFKKIDHLYSYVGLIPNTHSSGEKQVIGRMTHRGNHFLKYILVESAWTAVRKDPALMIAFKELCKRMDANKAIIRMTKKLLNRIVYVMKNKTPYIIGKVS